MGLRITPAAEAHPCIPEDEQKTQRLLQNSVTLCHLCLPCTCLVTRHPTLGASPAWGARGHHNVPGVPTAKLQVLLRDGFPDPGGHMKLGQHEGWRCPKLTLHFSQLSLGALSRGPGVAPALASAGACTKSHYPLHLLSTGVLGGVIHQCSHADRKIPVSSSCSLGACGTQNQPLVSTLYWPHGK